MTRWTPDTSLEAGDGHLWLQPAPDDCPHCLCHTARVCASFQWHRAQRPTRADGTPHEEPCPCETAAQTPEDRTVVIELDGVLRQIPAQRHRTGFLVGRMVTDRVFRAEDPDLGECPVPVPMLLHRPLESTDPRLIVVDSNGDKWVMSMKAQHNLHSYKITGWYPA